ncbi:hypothetical protein COBT_002093 [Conglomerata obtusa]
MDLILTKAEHRLIHTLRKFVQEKKLNVRPRIAGGWVRDKLLHIPSTDIDIVVDTMSGLEFAKKFKKYGKNTFSKIGVIKENPEQSKHMETAAVMINGMHVDFLQLRSEVYNIEIKGVEDRCSFVNDNESIAEQDNEIDHNLSILNENNIESRVEQDKDISKNVSNQNEETDSVENINELTNSVDLINNKLEELNMNENLFMYKQEEKNNDNLKENMNNNKNPNDLVTLNNESNTTINSTMSRIPETKPGCTIEDALRRDITINTLYYNIMELKIEDLTGEAIGDLQNGIIRTPLEPLQTFMDDPLRILRVIRFATRYNFAIEKNVLEAMKKKEVKEAFLRKISKERIGTEINQITQDVNGMKLLLDNKLEEFIFGLSFNTNNNDFIKNVKDELFRYQIQTDKKNTSLSLEKINEYVRTVDCTQLDTKLYNYSNTIHEKIINIISMNKTKIFVVREISDSEKIKRSPYNKKNLSTTQYINKYKSILPFDLQIINLYSVLINNSNLKKEKEFYNVSLIKNNLKWPNAFAKRILKIEENIKYLKDNWLNKNNNYKKMFKEIYIARITAFNNKNFPYMYRIHPEMHIIDMKKDIKIIGVNKENKNVVQNESIDTTDESKLNEAEIENINEFIDTTNETKFNKAENYYQNETINTTNPSKLNIVETINQNEPLITTNLFKPNEIKIENHTEKQDYNKKGNVNELINYFSNQKDCNPNKNAIYTNFKNIKCDKKQINNDEINSNDSKQVETQNQCDNTETNQTEEQSISFVSNSFFAKDEDQLRYELIQLVRILGSEWRNTLYILIFNDYDKEFIQIIYNLILIYNYVDVHLISPIVKGNEIFELYKMELNEIPKYLEKGVCLQILYGLYSKDSIVKLLNLFLEV